MNYYSFLNFGFSDNTCNETGQIWETSIVDFQAEFQVLYKWPQASLKVET